MPISNFERNPTPPPQRPAETVEQREARLAWEREMLDEARAEFTSGQTMDPGEVEAWLAALASDEDHPIPELRPAGRARQK